MGLGGAYWLAIAVFAGFCVLGFALAVMGGPRGRGLGLTVGALFGCLCLGGILWPLLRLREKSGVSSEWVEQAYGPKIEAILFPASRVKQIVVLLGSAVGVPVGIGLALYGGTLKSLLVGGLLAPIALGFNLLWLSGMVKRRQGILLLPTGLVWREMLYAPYFIPWDALETFALFYKKEENVPRPLKTIGLRVTNPALVETSDRSRRAITGNLPKHGWHLYYFAESLTAPLELVARTVQFYHANPAARAEIGTLAGQKRVQEFSAALDNLPG